MRLRHLLPLLPTLITFAAAGDCPSLSYAPSQPSATYSVAELAVIDLNHDGHDDLVGTAYVPLSVSRLYSWQGRGDGTFDDPTPISSIRVTQLSVGDVNGDGFDDIVTGSDGGAINTFLGGQNGFSAPVTTGIGFVPAGLQVARIDDDEWLDVVVSHPQSGAVLYRGTGNGSFIEAQRAPRHFYDSYGAIAAADFDQDGVTDTVVADTTYNEWRVHFRYGPKSSFIESPPLPAESGTMQVRAADLNADGLPDIVATSGYRDLVYVYLNVSGRTFTRSILKMSDSNRDATSGPLEIRDVNGDGRPDIIAAERDNYGGRLETFLGNGDGSFRSPVIYLAAPGVPRAGNVTAIAVGDFDGNSTLDVAAGIAASSLFLSTLTSTCGTSVFPYSISPKISAGDTAPLRAVVSGVRASDTQRGTVTFTDGTTILGTADVGTDGVATYNAAGLATGSHCIVAAYSGSPSLAAAVSPCYQVTVVATTATGTLSIAPSAHDTPFQVEWSYTYEGLRSGGSLRLTIDGEVVGDFTGYVPTFRLYAGTHTIAGRFLGTEYNPAADTPTYTIQTAQGDPKISASVSANPSSSRPTTFTSLFQPATSPVPTGTIEVFRGTPDAGRVSLGAVTVSGGRADVTANLPAGSYDITTVYSGDKYYRAVTLQSRVGIADESALGLDAYANGNQIQVTVVNKGAVSMVKLYRREAAGAAWTWVSQWGGATASGPDPLPVQPGVVYIYRIEGNTQDGVPLSAMDSAIVYSDPAVIPGGTVSFRSLSEARDAINGLRQIASLPPLDLGSGFAIGGLIRASHVASLRSGLAEARAKLHMLALEIAEPSLTGVPIRARHVNELRYGAQ